MEKRIHQADPIVLRLRQEVLRLRTVINQLKGCTKDRCSLCALCCQALWTVRGELPFLVELTEPEVREIQEQKITHWLRNKHQERRRLKRRKDDIRKSKHIWSKKRQKR